MSLLTLGTTAGQLILSPGGLIHEHSVTHTLITPDKHCQLRRLLFQTHRSQSPPEWPTRTSNSEWPKLPITIPSGLHSKSFFLSEVIIIHSYSQQTYQFPSLSHFPTATSHLSVPCSLSLGRGLTAMVDVQLHVPLLFHSSPSTSILLARVISKMHIGSRHYPIQEL